MGSCSGLCSKVTVEKPIILNVSEIEVVEIELNDEYYHVSAQMS